MTNTIAEQRVQNMKDQRNALIARVTHTNLSSSAKSFALSKIRTINKALGLVPHEGSST